MTQSTKTISPLRQRMIDDMMLRKLSPTTQANYLRSVANFTRFLGRSPDTATAEDSVCFNCIWRKRRPPVPVSTVR